MLSPFYYKIINFYFSPNPIYSSTKGPSEGSLKIISFNILYTNKDLDPTIDLIRQEKPDIIFVYEMKPDQYEGLQNALSPEYSAYPSLVDNGVFTKLNLNLNYENRIENNYSYRKVSLTYNQKDYHIYAIHPAAPIAQKYREHRDIYMEKLVADINLNSNSNIVVVGDFNMTPWAKAYEDFKINTKNIFTDIAQGKGYDDTWSPIPNPFIGVDYLDHIWITNQVKPLTYKSIIVKGSDHKALIFNFN
jgi:endonuclease/exonuclease/phosphatase (EEP) superfamily protein YafD